MFAAAHAHRMRGQNVAEQDPELESSSPKSAANDLHSRQKKTLAQVWHQYHIWQSMESRVPKLQLQNLAVINDYV